MIEKRTKVFQYGQHTVTLETGEIARQATAAVLVKMGGTAVLVTVVAKKAVAAEQDFFPLTVNYQEKFYAGGRIPGGFLKREGRPSENETLVSRLIDRPIRPLFPDDFLNEIQVVATVLSLDPAVNPDIVSLIGASAALTLSGVPFQGPLGAARVGYRDGQYLLNPSVKDLETSALDLVVAGTEAAVLMVESEAQQLPEAVMLEAVWWGHAQMQVVIQAINEFVDEVGVVAWEFTPKPVCDILFAKVKEAAAAAISEAYQIPQKTLRQTKLAEVKTKVLADFADANDADRPCSKMVAALFEKLERDIVRHRILDGYPRIDGRDTRTVRPLAIRVGVLDRTHGSALFTRGETQALVVTTLGSKQDAQLIDSVMGESKDTFMFNYNFPPYCVGETGMMGSPKRREIGHGRLAKRGVAAIMPDQKTFPYVVRVVSEITESNGSSSMASVCGACLSLMDAGVPIKAPVAGIAMGLVKEDKKFAVLTDILGDEDHLGDMDFKVAGSQQGVTALQMDIKITGITKFIMQKALEQAQAARLHILQHMTGVLAAPRAAVSSHAPRMINMKIDPDKIREVIGKGGAVIRALTETYGVNIDLEDNGNVTIYAVDGDSGEKARQHIEGIVAVPEIGKTYEGAVTKLLDFGLVVSFLPGQEGLVHISQIREGRVENVADEFKLGDVVKVRVLEIDRQGRVRLTMKFDDTLSAPAAE